MNKRIIPGDGGKRTGKATEMAKECMTKKEHLILYESKVKDSERILKKKRGGQA